MILAGKRVLLVGPLPPPVGGDTVSTASLLASGYWSEAGFEIGSVDTSAGEGIRLPGNPRSASDIGRGFRIIRETVFGLRRADAVLLWMNTSFACSLGIPLMSACLAAGRPYVVKVFGTMLAEGIAGLGPLRGKIVVNLLNRAYQVLPQTRLLAEDLKRRSGIDPDRVTQLPNFIPDRFLGGRTGKDGFEGRCVFMGQIKREKGVFDIIEALRGSGRYRCDFYGGILDRDREEFERAVSSSANCEYRGVLKRDDVMETLGRYGVLLLPTMHPGEGYPAVIIEAFAAGLPVVATRWRSLPELIEDGRTGVLVDPGSPRKLSEALDMFFDDQSLYREMAGNALARAADFSEGRVVGDVLIGMVRRALGADR